MLLHLNLLLPKQLKTLAASNYSQFPQSSISLFLQLLATRFGHFPCRGLMGINQPDGKVSELDVCSEVKIKGFHLIDNYKAGVAGERRFLGLVLSDR